MISQIESPSNRFQNTRARQNERGILCWRLLTIITRTCTIHTNFTSTNFFSGTSDSKCCDMGDSKPREDSPMIQTESNKEKPDNGNNLTSLVQLLTISLVESFKYGYIIVKIKNTWFIFIFSPYFCRVLIVIHYN